MKILLMSDTHFGFGSGMERWEDAFIAFQEGIEKGLTGDAILLGGDIFDTRIPSQETFARTMELLLPTQRATGATVVEGIKKQLPGIRGLPVISISGNHERRVRGLVNPVEALERGGFLIHLHCNGVVLEKDGERVAIHGMSAVPGEYALQVLEQWSPQPVPGAYNILVIHQNLDLSISEHPFPREALPKGFDLYLCGDIHDAERTEVHGKPLILPGSAVVTQVNKSALTPRQYGWINTQAGTVELVAFERQRKMYYQDVKTREEAMTVLEKIKSEQHVLPPVIKFATALSAEEVRSLQPPGILMIAQDKPVAAKSIEEQKQSAVESGEAVLERNLKTAGLDVPTFRQVFELLLHDQSDQAVTRLREPFKATP